MAGEQELRASGPRPEARLGLALRRARQSRGISLRGLARRLHRSHSTLVEYERGHRLAPLDVVEAYETELGVVSGTLAAIHEQARLEVYGEDRSHRRTYVLKPVLDPPHQLPPDVADFTGRAAELGRLRAVVAERSGGTVVISAIAGTAGVGKTALAVHLAHELAAAFPDVQLYMNLHGYEPAQRLAPTRVLDRFLRALGVPADALPADLDEQAGRYRGLLAGRRALVVLDNASSADQVRPLLPASPSCLVLITSRDRLAGLVAAEGARVLMLDVLSPPESLDLLSRTTGPERVAAEPEAAAEVVRLCGCLPLAVRIAGARLATRPDKSVAALAERLSDERDRLGELSAGDVGVRASFALSYGALDPEVARTFRRLGLVPGPDFAPAVAAALVDATPEEGEAALEALVDAHLVEVGPIPGRYRFHDLLRLYARERAETDETDQDRDEARRRMLEWYLDTADAAERHLAPWRRRLPYQRAVGWPQPVFAGREEALAWFEVELPALVGAVREAAKYGFHPIAWLLPDALGSVFSLRSYYADWQRTIRIGLAAARKVRNRRAEAWTMTSLAHTQRELHKVDEELFDLYRRSLAIFREVGDPQGEARALHGLGGTYLHIGRLREAIACQEQVLAISRGTNDLYREEVAFRHLGWAYRVLRRFDDAIDCHNRSLAISGELGNRLGGGSSLYSLGEVYCDLGRFDEAIHCARRSLAINREFGSRGGEGRSLNLLGVALQNTQGIEAARACWQEALHILAELGLPQADEVRDRLADAGRTP